MTDGTGTVVATYKYDVFGAIRSSGGTASTEYRFTGQQNDAASGYTYLRARYYDPSTGRFISKDPFPGLATDPASEHYYSYVQNSPVNLTDPSGKFPPLPSLSVGEGYVDVNVSFGTWWIGGTGGLMFAQKGRYPYVGYAAVFPTGGAVAVTYSGSDPCPGLNAGIQATAPPIGSVNSVQVGYGPGGPFSEAGFGFGLPSITASVFWVFGLIPWR